MEYINKYRTMLLSENQNHNLVSRRTLEEEFDKHVQDSLEVLNHTHWENLTVVDMGSGAGFPGLILAMNCPNVQFVLVESDKKKSTFLEQAALQLDLNNVIVDTRRLEEVGQDKAFRERFDVVTARALASLNVLLEYGIPLLKTGGTGWFWKGTRAAEEVAQAETALHLLQARVENIYWYRLIEERDRALVKVVKQGPTPEKYPRRVGIPTKRPL
ncbi:MAG TPA: 16S rRNA (guanine(527)-N(7))-methyltransferase RsmG [Syntrophomonadaceae bacterium]|nr:16S rRNA (guanine(527)-N(7))-methyltransferase RsmG [Syntrophomonadaceae bacterium]HQA07526.1 16S rRNA (guanine(527)-N(7))-methyltransferase RsmG [Syntrophomonadaceae bacterium]HQE23018.1 16S rRNA (guanine(527)-N(7))-methyltransferase RsmG [Syntrophomonadaceae bacterium]